MKNKYRLLVHKYGSGSIRGGNIILIVVVVIVAVVMVIVYS